MGHPPTVIIIRYSSRCNTSDVGYTIGEGYGATLSVSPIPLPKRIHSHEDNCQLSTQHWPMVLVYVCLKNNTTPTDPRTRIPLGEGLGIRRHPRGCSWRWSSRPPSGSVVATGWDGCITSCHTVQQAEHDDVTTCEPLP
eukprot:GFYU01001170.1.p1 GENE.GFYU01001170.1~~GFYU01001170.1.p1  ORF type:complete len:139 (-),score=9.41 GFYU01001170.1:453-869(-)